MPRMSRPGRSGRLRSAVLGEPLLAHEPEGGTEPAHAAVMEESDNATQRHDSDDEQRFHGHSVVGSRPGALCSIARPAVRCALSSVQCAYC